LVLSSFASLDPIAVGAKQLIAGGLINEALEKCCGILQVRIVPELLTAATVDMVHLQSSWIGEPATAADSAEKLNDLRSIFPSRVAITLSS
jgi:hypothetical protein